MILITGKNLTYVGEKTSFLLDQNVLPNLKQ